MLYSGHIPCCCCSDLACAGDRNLPFSRRFVSGLLLVSGPSIVVLFPSPCSPLARRLSPRRRHCSEPYNPRPLLEAPSSTLSSRPPRLVAAPARVLRDPGVHLVLELACPLPLAHCSLGLLPLLALLSLPPTLLTCFALKTLLLAALW